VARIFCLALLLAGTASPLRAQKTDIVELDDGNIVIGEIKKLEYGLLTYKTDYMGTLDIRWSHVVRLTSNQLLDVELSAGEHLYGSLIEGSADGKLQVLLVDATVEVEVSEVVKIEPIKSSFWKRIDGSLKFGFNFTKSTNQVQLNSGVAAKYRARRWLAEFNFDTNITGTSETDSKTNTVANFSYFRFRKGKWFSRGDVGGTRNDELGIALRAYISGGGGRNWIQSNRSLLLTSAMLSANREVPIEGETTSNLELVLDNQLRIFRRDSPKTDLLFKLTIYPSLSDWGRVRVTSDTTFRQELIKDFFFDLSGYYTYDSDPPQDALSQEDYGIVTSLGYTF
jgi:hypothetical protein